MKNMGQNHVKAKDITPKNEINISIVSYLFYIQPIKLYSRITWY